MKKLQALILFAAFQAAAVGTLRADDPSEPIELTLEKFVELSLSKSYNSQITKDSFQSTTLSYTATRRDLTAPKLTLASQVSRTKNLQDTSRSASDAFSSQVQAAQPFLWGGSLSVTGEAQSTEQLNETLTDGEIVSSAQTYSRNFPQLSLTYSQPLYVFLHNQKWRGWRRNEIGYQNARNTFQRDLQSLELDARAAYYDALVSSEQIAVEREKLKSSEALTSITKALVDAGRSAPVELTRAQINLKLDQRRLRNAETAWNQTMNNLKNQVLIPESQSVRLTSRLDYRPVRAGLERLQNVALTYRLDLQNARQNITLARMDLEDSRDPTRPDLSTSFSYKYDSPAAGDHPLNWTVSASLNWPFFDSRVTALRVKERKISLANAQRQLDLTTRQALVEVQNAYLELQRAEEQILDFAETRRQAENNIGAVRIRYEKGLDRLIDVFDAESKLRDLDLEYLNLLLTYNKAKDRLSFLIGKNVEEAAKP